ncbi:MAG: cytochrome c-type biogenesis protein [Aquabacterium sp.]
MTPHLAGRARRAAVGMLLALLAAASALADSGTAETDRLHALAAELRCLVCQNESLADSHAPLALDLKREIRAQMSAGRSDDEIRTFLVQRYGDFVTYRPPLDGRTLLLWAAPLLLLAGGLAGLWRHWSRAAAPMPPEEART